MIETAETLSLQYANNFFSGGHDDAGAWRYVKLAEGCVFKSVGLPQHLDSFFEWAFYTSVCDEVREFLCKPLYISRNKRTVVMERVLIVDDENEFLRHTDRTDRLRQLLSQEYDINGFSDLRRGNVGLRKDGKLVVTDYANLVHNLGDKLVKRQFCSSEEVKKELERLNISFRQHKDFDQTDIAFALSI